MWSNRHLLMLIVVISVWTRNLTTYCIHALRSIREPKCEVKLVVHVHGVVVKSCKLSFSSNSFCRSTNVLSYYVQHVVIVHHFVCIV